MTRAIDTFVNVHMGNLGRPDYLVRVAEDYFKRADAIFKSYTPPQLIEEMDKAGVTKAVITVDAEHPSPDVLAFPKADPQRFVLSVYVDPRRGMAGLRELSALVKNEPVVLARTTPFMVGCIAPNEACYYPLYAKCIDLEIPCAVNTGLPGPPVPGKCQDPLHLDEVCYFFPELVLIMAHGADPWWGEAIRLLLKYPNLYMMTSAYLPKYLPAELLHFMNTRGQDKVLFATDFPFLPFDRCAETARALDLKPPVLEKYLRDNARRVFRFA